MLRPLCALLVGIAISSAASATTLSVSPDKLTYDIGETITLTVHGDDEGVTALSIFGRLLYNGALVDNGTRSQKTIVGAYGNWIKGILDADDTNAAGPGSYSQAFDQITTSNGDTAENLPADNPFATVTLIAVALGTVNVAWDTSTGSNTQLTFFGLTSAPGTSFTIVPEPATGAFFGLGLLALAFARRPT